MHFLALGAVVHKSGIEGTTLLECVIIMDAYNYVLLVCMSDLGIVLHITSNLKGILTYDGVWLS